jgi:transposase
VLSAESIQKHLQWLEQELAEVERKIDELMKQSDELSAARDLLMSVPGVGKVTAKILRLGPKAVAALAGLAPMANQSGTKDKRRRIHGGRPDVRHVLYMGPYQQRATTRSFDVSISGLSRAASCSRSRWWRPCTS